MINESHKGLFMAIWKGEGRKEMNKNEEKGMECNKNKSFTRKKKKNKCFTLNFLDLTTQSTKKTPIIHIVGKKSLIYKEKFVRQMPPWFQNHQKNIWKSTFPFLGQPNNPRRKRREGGREGRV